MPLQGASLLHLTGVACRTGLARCRRRWTSGTAWTIRCHGKYAPPAHSLHTSVNARLVSNQHRRYYQSAAVLADDTIFALSTPSGQSAIAVIRLSGPAALHVYSRLCQTTVRPKARRVQVKTLYDPQFEVMVKSTAILDPSALILYFAAPQSATSQDVIEFHVHGGKAIIRSVLQAISSCSTSSHRIRHAEPGEFTKRAFLSGRMDLTQAEALGAVLAAETEQQRRVAVIGSRSGKARLYDEWQTLLIDARGQLEALIDFAEDQQFDESPDDLLQDVTDKVVELCKIISLHRDNAVRGELLRNGIQLTILGRPNAGKSSLLNAMTNRDAAIVSHQAGTTRDIVEVSLDINGFLVRIADTAGLRYDSSSASPRLQKNELDAVEVQGIQKALSRARQSDVVLLLLAVEASADANSSVYIGKELVAAAQDCLRAGKQVVVAINKSDLVSSKDLGKLVDDVTDQMKELFSEERFHNRPETSSALGPPIAISCLPSGMHDSCSLSPLMAALTRVFTFLTEAELPTATNSVMRDVTVWQEALSATERQRGLLNECLVHLHTYMKTVTPSGTQSDAIDVVLAAEMLRNAAACLARITGHGANDVEQVLGVVFEKFCVGK